MENVPIPVLVIDDTPVKRRGVSEFVEETPQLESELYSFFAIEGAPSDPGRRVLLAHAYEAYSGERSE
jgi:hypothetical protein